LASAWTKNTHPFGKNMKLIHKISQKQRLLAPTENDEIIAKSQGDTNMTAVAADYGCCYTTVGRVLRDTSRAGI
jgi:hypothetical protein